MVDHNRVCELMGERKLSICEGFVSPRWRLLAEAARHQVQGGGLQKGNRFSARARARARACARACVCVCVARVTRSARVLGAGRHATVS